VNLASVRRGAFEARDLLSALGDRPGRPSGRIVVSGMLAEQLARQLGEGASPGAVAAGDARGARADDVLVHVIAADPSEDDLATVRTADEHDVPVVLVQLWPQEDWTAPFVLTPFVVECRAGEGFPVEEIAARIVDAAAEPDALAARVPLLEERVASGTVREAAIRAGFLAFLGSRRGSSRPLIALEQARMVARLQAASPAAPEGGVSPALVGTAAALAASGLAFRELARTLRATLPAPLVHAAIAGGATWALGEAVRRLEARGAAG
jgi:hypothetical protein